MNSLYFTSEEEKIFASLDADLQKNWTVEQETLTYNDTPERRAFRFQIMRVQDPILLRFQEQAINLQTDEEFMKLAKAVDLKEVDTNDLTHIVFALGPDAMTAIITELLKNTKKTEDVELAAAFAALRHGMLESFRETSHLSL